ncbi:MBL fold metallo-hydrolase [Salicibibacter cibarius]|uniref:MBL fold metallo-hydrolase n=1 Tax=Salicibibacter cibarius TaxID=2743000 RepID=A0A7T7CBD3_9BACI|nr:MBL fold metallo-hydrolase [Salicibibacter cibarius]QQK75854.1 MBL fold metallo-hydrolase [Salicibibacter cibarius]
MKRKLLHTIFLSFVIAMMGCDVETDDDEETVDAEAEENEEESEQESNEDEEIEEQGTEEDENGDEETSDEEESNEEEESAEEAEGDLTAHFIDVGQGDSILLEGPDFNILVDTGRHDRDEVVPYIEDQDIEQLDLVVGTHSHADHIGQLDRVMHNLDIDEVWMNGEEGTSDTFERALDAVLESDADYEEPDAGDTDEIGSAEIEVVHPQSLSGDPNDDSIVMSVSYGDTSFMLTGDAEEAAESEMVNSDHELDADILKVGHHGSDTSSTSSFLEEVSPETAVYQAGEGNSYGHPHDEAVDRITSMDIELYGTAEHGHVLITTDGDSYDVETVSDSEPTSSSEEPETDADSEDESSEEEETEEEESTEEDAEEETGSSEACEDGEVAINSASEEELQEIVEIGDDRAGQIIDLRDSQDFESYSDLTRIDGIADARADTIEEQGIICFD